MIDRIGQWFSDAYLMFPFDASFEGYKTDVLYGLKENVIVGRLIPAGTGSMTKSYTEVAKERDLAKLAERRKNQENIENLEQ